jgi:hypothetical protein
MLGVVIPLSSSGEHITKSRSRSDGSYDTAMDGCCISWHGFPVRDADVLGHLDWEVHPFGESESLPYYGHGLTKPRSHFG